MHSDASDPTLRLSDADRPSSSRTGKGWQPPSPGDLQHLLPQYDITVLLGRGGMGAVYKGVQRNLDRPVAIKILPPGIDESDDGANFTERFKNEARAMARLSHPGIVAVYDFGETSDGLLYIVMEFIEGTDVQRMLSEQGRLHSAHALAITAHVCDALKYAHERGIVHRDIKPANIMVGFDGVVKVADFGLAKMNRAGESGLTRSGMAMGTLHYMAPEALMLGSSVDHRADIYAVGVMLYCMLTGKLPQGMFELPSLQVPGLDPRFDGIIAKSLRDDREIRFQTTAELRHELDGILTQPVVKVEPAQTPPPPALPTDARPQPARNTPRLPQTQVVTRVVEKRSSPFAWLAVLALTGAVIWLWQTRTADPPAAAAAPMADTPSASSSSSSSPAPVPPVPGPVHPTPAPATPAPVAQTPPSSATSATSPPSLPPKPPVAQETLTVTPGLQPGVWLDVLARGLRGASGLSKRPGEPATFIATSGVTCSSNIVLRDCIVRARFSGAWTAPPALIVRYQDNPNYRYVSAAFAGDLAQLRYHLPNNWTPFVMRGMAAQVSPGEPLDVELKAVGDRFTFSRNGVVVADGPLSGYPLGRVGLSVSTGTIIEKLEVMPLESTGAPATPAAISTTADGWRPLLEEKPELVNKLRISDSATPGWKIMQQGFAPVLETNNVALRLKLRNHQHFRVVTHLHNTTTDDGRFGYTLMLGPDVTGNIRFASGWINQVSALGGMLQPTGYIPFGQRPLLGVPPGQECEVVLKIYDKEIIVEVDGRQILQTPVPLPGRVTGLHPAGPFEFKDLAWRPLAPKTSSLPASAPATPSPPAPAPSAPSAPAPTPQDTRSMKLLVDADFKRSQPDFRDVSMPELVAFWQGGSYQLSSRSRTQWSPPLSVLHDLELKDFVYEAEFRVTKEDAGFWGVALAPQRRPAIEVRMDSFSRPEIYRPQIGFILNRTGVSIPPGGKTWHQMRIEGQGSTLRLFINNRHVADVSRSDVEQPHGLTMFITCTGELFEVWFHRIRVWDSSPDASLAAAKAPSPPPPAVPRQWVDNQGRKITASFVRADQTTLTVRTAGGQEWQLPMSKLSAESQRLAEQLAAGKAP
ncbi:protein kinase domain-containing protein [Prosthecobacter sp.]|uniref:serine/threonine-protein kinase n=1 Tax=Prosthecobacter sp. TaxID=1965333 RepID=UPI0037849A8E